MRLKLLTLLVLVVSQAAEAAIGCNNQNSTVPVAVDDRVDWPAGQLVIPVLQNDYDPDGQALTITSVSSPGPAGQVQISGQTIIFTPAPGYTTAQFSYSIVDSSGQSCATPAWVYVREAGPQVSFTSVCTARDCNFTTTLSTLENFKDYTWRFCPGRQPCSTLLREHWTVHGYLIRFPYAGLWTAEVEAHYYTGKVARFSATLDVLPVIPFIEFRQWPADETNDLCIEVEITATNVRDTFTAQYQMFWGDNNNNPTPIDHLAGTDIVGKRLTHCYAEPGLWPVMAHVKTDASPPEEGSSLKLINVVNAPPDLDLVLTLDPNDSKLVHRRIEMRDDRGFSSALSGNTQRELDMGDGTVERQIYNSEDSPYRYKTPGTYHATLRYTDHHGLISTITREITIPNTAPSGRLTVQCEALTCTLSAVDTNDDLGLRSYTWNVGGTTVTTTTPAYTHKFAAAGRYAVSATFSDGELSTPVLNRVIEARAAAPSQDLVYYAVPPCRGYDSNTSPLTAGTVRLVSLASCIPSDARAVELNATIVSATHSGHLVLWSPTDNEPGTSNLSFVAGVTRANNGAVRTSGRSINSRLVTAAGGSARLIVDVVGYYAPYRAAVAPHTGPFGLNVIQPPSTMRDSRVPGGQKLAASILQEFSGWAYPRFLNVTTFNSSSAGHLIAYATGAAVPSTSIQNFPVGSTVTNGAIVAPNPTSGKFTLKYSPSVSTSTADYRVDSIGTYYPAVPEGDRYEMIRPCRLLDTRDPAYGEPRLKANVKRHIYVGGNCGTPAMWQMNQAVRLNLTVVNPSAAGRLSVIDQADSAGAPWPARVEFLAGSVVGNATIVQLQSRFYPPSSFDVISDADTDLIVDVVGYQDRRPTFEYANWTGLNVGYTMHYRPSNGGTDPWFGVWDYGDGTTGPASSASRRCKTYDLPGTYPVSLTAWNDSDPNRRTVYQRSVTITNQAPQAAFTTSQTGKLVYADASASSDEPPASEWLPGDAEFCETTRSNAGLTFTWDFGDSTTGTGRTTQHVYTAPGVRTVTLTARDRAGASASTTRTVTIPDEPPTARFTFNCIGRDCQFDASASTDDVAVTSYQWMFGTTSRTTTTPATTFTFAADGKYTVTLTASDGQRTSNPARRVATVTAAKSLTGYAFHSMTPCRVFDSRSTSRLTTGVVRTVKITGGPCAIPAAAKVAALSVTVFDTSSGGYLQVYRPGTSTTLPFSSLNWDGPAMTRTNHATAHLNDNGEIAIRPSMSSSATTHVIVDVTGYYAAENSGLTPAGSRFRTVAPCRVFDSRSTPANPLFSGTALYAMVRGKCGIPASLAADATAGASLNLHIVSPQAAGHVMVLPSNRTTTADTSTIAGLAPGRTEAVGMAIGLGGRVNDDLSLKYLATAGSSAHWVLDTTGYWAGGNELLYYPINNCRLANTTLPEHGDPRLIAGMEQRFQVRGNCGVPAWAKAVIVNATIVTPNTAGHLMLWPAGAERPEASALDWPGGETARGSMSIVPLASSVVPDLAVTAGSSGGDLVLDVVGYFANPADVPPGYASTGPPAEQ